MLLRSLTRREEINTRFKFISVDSAEGWQTLEFVLSDRCHIIDCRYCTSGSSWWLSDRTLLPFCPRLYSFVSIILTKITWTQFLYSTKKTGLGELTSSRTRFLRQGTYCDTVNQKHYFPSIQALPTISPLFELLSSFKQSHSLIINHYRYRLTLLAHPFTLEFPSARQPFSKYRDRSSYPLHSSLNTLL